jgi:ribonuclease P protein component
MKTTKMLKKNYEFKQVLTRGKYYSGQYIKAFIIKNNKQNNFLGLAISTKVRKS